jgi:hypothetical protein
MRAFCIGFVIFFLGAMILSTGCATNNPGSMISSASKAMGISNPVFEVPTQIQATAVLMIDSLCPPPLDNPIPGDKGFLAGMMKAADVDLSDVLTVKQSKDVNMLLDLCALPKDQRRLDTYGYLTYRGVQTLFGLAMKAAAAIK